MPAIFSLLVAIAGWFYLFYSQAAYRLHGIEDERINRRRIRLRRANGFVMLLLAGFFFAGFYRVDVKESPGPFLAVWIVVFFLMFLVVLLGLLDVWFTAKLRRNRPNTPPTS